MQVTPIESFQPTHYHKSSEDQSQNCGKCHLNLDESDSSSHNSSSEEMSQSFSIELKTNRLQSTQNIKHLENQIKRLSTENEILLQKNKQLLIRLQNAEIGTSLKKQLKSKQNEIRNLKKQLTNNAYGISLNSKTQLQSPLVSKKKLQIQDSERLKSNKCKLTKNEYFPPKSTTQFQINEVKQLRDKWKIQKIELQKQICLLEEKILIYENETNWMLNLVNKVIGLSQKLGNIFKQKPINSKWPAKKQSKQAWRYLKHILQYFLLIQ